MHYNRRLDGNLKSRIKLNKNQKNRLIKSKKNYIIINMGIKRGEIVVSIDRNTFIPAYMCKWKMEY